jgi:hypothetical protein
VARALALLIVVAQALIFGAHVRGVAPPVLYWDTLGYYHDASTLFVNWNLPSIQRSWRPIFSWPGVLALRLVGQDSVTPHLLLVLNGALYVLVLLGSTYWLLRLLREPALAALAAWSTLLSMPLLLALATSLYGDLALAAWAVLTVAILTAFHMAPHRTWLAFLLGVVSAVGLQTKPMFLFLLVMGLASFGFLQMAALLVGRDSGAPAALLRERLQELGRAAVAFAVGFAPLAYLVLPRRLPALIRELAYANETLGYWQWQAGLFNGILWLPTVALGELALVPALVLGLAVGLRALVGLAAAMRALGAGDPILPVRGLIRRMVEHPGVVVVLVLVLTTLYLSAFVNHKDPRVTFFILPLGVVVGMSCLASLLRGWGPRCRWFLIGLMATQLAVTAAWADVAPPGLAVLRWYGDLTRFRVVVKRPEQTTPISYRSIGAMEIVAALERDCSRRFRCGQSPSLVFVPHSSTTYNESIFDSVRLVRGPVVRGRGLPHSVLRFSTAVFHRGGFGQEGGIPRAFLTAHYVLLVEGNLRGHLSGRTEVYNRTVAEALTKGRPEFLDGLEAIYETRNALGDRLVVFARTALPSPASFAGIVTALAREDPDNLWNVSWLHAALQIEPEAPELRAQLARMGEPDFRRRASYRYGTPAQEARIEAILSGRGGTPGEEAAYPSLIVQW